MAKNKTAATLPVLVTPAGVVTSAVPVKLRSRKVSGKNKDAAERRGEPIDLLAWLKDGSNQESDVVNELLKGERTMKDGRLVSIVSENWTLAIEVAKRKVPTTKEGKLYEMEYAALLPRTASAAVMVVENNLDQTFDKDGNELPSVLKYFRQGYGMLARNAAGAAIAAQVEGPEKAKERTILSFMKHKGWSRDKAEAKYALLMED
jgi:hypothetical protein